MIASHDAQDAPVEHAFPHERVSEAVSGSSGSAVRSSAASVETGTLGKAMAIIEAVADAAQAPRFKDLLDVVEQPRGTLHRNISNLIAERLLAQRVDGTYELGARFLKLASRSWSGNQFRVIAEPHLMRLHEATGETVHLGLLTGTEIIYLDKVESRSAVRMHSQIGNVSPVHCTGVGKAAVSGLSEQGLERLLDQLDFRKFTETTITTREAFREEIRAIHRNGFVYDQEEHETGIACVAAPIISAKRGILAGVSVTAPTYRVSMEQLTAWAPNVREIARAISDDIATRLGPKV